MAAKALKTLWLLHGVNLDMLGRRDPAVYGTMTLTELESYVARHGEAFGFTVHSFQTNFEGEMVEKVHQLVLDGADAAIVNPGATRTAMRAKAVPGEDPMTLPAPEDVAPLFLDLARPESTVNGEIVRYREWVAARAAAAAQ